MNEKTERAGWSGHVIPLLGLVLILTIAPACFTTLTRDIFTLPKAIPIALGLVLAWSAIAIDGAVMRCEIGRPMLAMAAVSLISTATAVDLPMAVLGPHQQQFYALLPMAVYGMTYMAAACLDEIPATTVSSLALAGAVLVSVPALVQATAGIFMTWTIQNGRVGSTYGSPIFLGSYLAMLLPLAWSVRKGFIGNAVFALILAALWAARSRGSLAAGLVGILLIEWLRGRRITFAASLAAAAVVVAAFVWKAHDSDVGRLEIWRSALMAWRAHPFLGWGPDTFPIAFRRFMTYRYIASNDNRDFFIQLSAHNDLLQVLATMGLLGMAAYGALLAGVTRVLRDAQRENSAAAGIAGATLAVFINAKFNPIPFSVLVVLAALTGSLDRSRMWERRHRTDPFHFRLFPGMAAIASMLLLVAYGAMCQAERHQRLGENLRQVGSPYEAAQEFNRAAQINPFDLWYTQRQEDYLISLLPFYGDEARRQVAAAALSVSARAVRLHPLDPTAHELRAIADESATGILGLDLLPEARREIGLAEMLAPHFSAYAKRRAQLDLMLTAMGATGDPGAKDAARKPLGRKS